MYIYIYACVPAFESLDARIYIHSPLASSAFFFPFAVRSTATATAPAAAAAAAASRFLFLLLLPPSSLALLLQLLQPQLLQVSMQLVHRDHEFSKAQNSVSVLIHPVVGGRRKAIQHIPGKTNERICVYVYVCILTLYVLVRVFMRRTICIRICLSS